MRDDVSVDSKVRSIAERYFAAVESRPLPSSLMLAHPSLNRARRGSVLVRALGGVAAFAAICAALTIVILVDRHLSAAGPPHTAPGGPSAPPSRNVCPPSTPVAHNGPVPPRSAAAMAFDAANNQVVLFGGDDDSGAGAALGDTWTWNGTAWSKRPVAPSPPGRIEAAMAYDAATKQVVLFSGTDTDGTPYDDTWVWNGVSWHQEHPATSPPPRADAAVAYDPLLGKIVMFGGWNPVVGGPAKYQDTWTWDGTNWTELFPTTVPPKRAEAVMAYDAGSRTLVMFGGDVATSSNETWVFDGRNWSEVRFALGAQQPAARDATVMAPDAANGTLVLFGGEESGGSSNDTWTWNGSAWLRAHPGDSPPSRGVETESAMMVYDPALGVDILYGGPLGNPQEAFGDTWTWNGSTWKEVANNGPTPQAPSRGPGTGC